MRILNFTYSWIRGMHKAFTVVHLVSLKEMWNDMNNSTKLKRIFSSSFVARMYSGVCNKQKKKTRLREKSIRRLNKISKGYAVAGVHCYIITRFISAESNAHLDTLVHAHIHARLRLYVYVHSVILDASVIVINTQASSRGSRKIASYCLLTVLVYAIFSYLSTYNIYYNNVIKPFRQMQTDTILSKVIYVIRRLWIIQHIIIETIRSFNPDNNLYFYDYIIFRNLT